VGGDPALRRHGMAALYPFGSHARNEASDGSDIDAFIDKDRTRPFGFDEFMDVYLLLQARLGGNVDYGTREGLHPELRPAIERQALPIVLLHCRLCGVAHRYRWRLKFLHKQEVAGSIG
jgi:predicted nucleotidyltransferase